MAKIDFTDKVTLISNPVAEINKFTAANANEIKASVNELYDTIPTGITEYIIVNDLDDLPESVGGVITLVAETCYFIVNTIDFLGSRLVGASNTTLLGTSSETSIITSTGLGVGIPLFSTQWTTPIRHIAFKDVDTALNIQGQANNGAYDWTGINFVNVPNVGVLNGGSNFIFNKGALLNSRGLRFTGTWATIGIENSLFQGDGALGDIIEVDNACVITRRFRMTYSAVIAFADSIGLTVDALATIPNEGFVLDTVSFSGGGTYLGGLTSGSIYSLFINCEGITNTYEASNYYMNANATVTVITTTGVAVKILGTTSSNPITQKFTNTNNRATYTGGKPRIFNVSAIASVTSVSSNDQVGVYIVKNGALIESSEAYLTTNASNRAENISIQTVIDLDTDDYIEVWIENSTDTSDVTVTDLNVNIRSL